MPWLDTLAFPKAGLSTELKDHPTQLKKLLHHGYKQCAAVIAIGTPNYGEKSYGSAENWTRSEWMRTIARENKPLRIVYLNSGKSESINKVQPNKFLDCINPEDTARELKEWFDSNNLP